MIICLFCSTYGSVSDAQVPARVRSWLWRVPHLSDDNKRRVGSHGNYRFHQKREFIFTTSLSSIRRNRNSFCLWKSPWTVLWFHLIALLFAARKSLIENLKNSGFAWSKLIANMIWLLVNRSKISYYEKHEILTSTIWQSNLCWLRFLQKNKKDGEFHLSQCMIEICSLATHSNGKNNYSCTCHIFNWFNFL